MIEKLRKFTIAEDLGKTFTIKLMPQINNKEPWKMLYMSMGGGSSVSEMYFGNAIVDGRIQPTLFGRTTFNIVKAAITSGYYALINPTQEDQHEGQFLGIDIDEIRSINQNEMIGGADPVFPEYEWVDQFIPYDIKNGKRLSFTIGKVDASADWSIMKIEKLRFVDGEPLYVDGEPKEKIISMYEGVPALDEIVEAYKADIMEKYPNALFGDDAKKAYWESKNKKASVSTPDDLFA
jgi:hypothetical protein